MRIISQEKIQSAINKKEVIAAVMAGFINHAKGQSIIPEPMQFLFKNKDSELMGDCHVKGAQSSCEDMFVVKIASGFYNNAQVGLPTNNGMVLLFSTFTGQP